MKKIYYILILLLSVSFFSGCTKVLDSEGVSKLTYYVTFELTQGSEVIHPMGTAFTDPGFKAFEGTTDVSGKVSVTGSVDFNTVGVYDITYSATNSDGFSASVTRTVIVYDPAAPVTDISGNYSSDVARQAPFTRSFTNLAVKITNKAPGVFLISDLLGGFYDQGSNYQYGPTYAMTGYVQLHSDNTFTMLRSFDQGFGDSLNSISGGVYDPVTKGLTWTADYTSNPYIFIITLTFI